MKYLALISLLLLASCSSAPTNSSATDGSVQFLLTDAPGDFVAVTVDIARVDVKRDGADWQTVLSDIEPQDLLELQNGATALLGETELSAGKYQQIRLILEAASVTVEEAAGNQTYDLTIPSSQNTGIKLIGLEVEADVITRVVLDFDAAASIKQTGQGYQLQPVIRAVADTEAGSVFGTVTATADEAPIEAPAAPTLAGATVRVTDAANVAVTTLSAEDGQFKLIALPAGEYRLDIEAEGYAPYSQMITVTAQVELDLGTISLNTTSVVVQ